MRAYDPESLEQAQPLMLDANNRILKTTKNGGSFIKSRHFLMHTMKRLTSVSRDDDAYPFPDCNASCDAAHDRDSCA
jgi:hypothetical protein